MISVVYPSENMAVLFSHFRKDVLPLYQKYYRLLLRVEEHRTRHQNGMGKRETLSLIYDKCMQPGSLNRDKLMH